MSFVRYYGTAGDDLFTGSQSKGRYQMQLGGDDIVVGGGLSDTIYMGGAFTAADRIDGGSGTSGITDTLLLDGDYSGGVVCTAETLKGIEAISLAAGWD